MSQDTNTSILTSHDLKGIASFIQSPQCKKIAIMAGAGISVSAGIPDFRSKGGFYKTLNIERDYAKICKMTKEQISYCNTQETNILTIKLFKENPACYYEARRPFIIAPMKYKATKTHFFFKTLFNKGLLKRFYSTNIDGLDSQCYFDDNILIHVHGTLGKASCINCKEKCDMDWFRNEIYQRNYPIRCTKCKTQNNWIKPGTILYGESLPKKFYDLMESNDLNDIDLCIIAGSSLSVFPSASIPLMVSKKCVRLLINRDKVGGNMYNWNNKKFNDVWYKGNCDDAVNELIKYLGWENDVIVSMIGNITKKNINGNNKVSDKLNEMKNKMDDMGKLIDKISKNGGNNDKNDEKKDEHDKTNNALDNLPDLPDVD